MNELALFAGAGGGILGGHLIGWRTVCAVEVEPYPASVLIQRQNDGLLPPFPVWDDVRTFDGRPWRGLVDVVSGGFPCQDISCAGLGKGIGGERSGLWAEMHRIIREVRPRYAFMENSPFLTSRGLGRVLGDLAEIGYDAEWTVLGADDLGAPHVRKRIWILAFNPHADGLQRPEQRGQHERPQESLGSRRDGMDAGPGMDRHADGDHEPTEQRIRGRQNAESGGIRGNVPNPDLPRAGRGQPQPRENESDIPDTSGARCHRDRVPERHTEEIPEPRRNTWWKTEPAVGRVVDGLAHRVDRLKAIGNGQVPVVAAAAFCKLHERLTGWQYEVKGGNE